MFNIITKLLAKIFPFIFSSRYKVIVFNLKLAFPHLSESGRKKIVNQCVEHTIYSTLSLPYIWKQDKAYFIENTTIEGGEQFKKYKNRGKILLVHHMIHIDYIQIALKHCLNLNFYATYKPAHNKMIDNYMVRSRTKHLQCLKSTDLRKIMKKLRNNCCVGLGIDQNTGYHKNTQIATFMGIKIYHWYTHIKLAQLTNSIIIPLIAYRLGLTKKQYIKIMPGIEASNNISPSQQIVETNKKIEDNIAYAPAQYLWTHRRFKSEFLHYPS